MTVPAGDPQLIVDLSNVCRDEALGESPNKASWSRFERVMQAWQDQMGTIPQGVAIADENLRFLFGPADRRQFELAERSGLVRAVPGAADAEILRWAEASGAAVLSRDRFVGHRRQHPWIQGATDRFFRWERADSGDVRVVAADMGTAGKYSISRGEETDFLKGRGLDPRRESDRELLAHAYRCTNPGCLTAKFSPDRLLVPPAKSERQPVCPGCKQPLEDLGPRPRAVELVIEHGEGELARKLLEEGSEITLGRSDLPRPSDEQTAQAVGRVSRSHLQVHIERSQLRIRDLESRNGTTVCRWDSVARSHSDPVKVAAGEQIELGHRDVALLGGAVRLRRSGQQFATGVTGSAGKPAGDPTQSESEDIG